MADEIAGDGKPGKRTDVGYKRPPLEHQFKKGQKPPPRRKKTGDAEVPMSEILHKVLHEPRRAIIGGKARWASGAELLIRRAFQEAEKGSSTLRRELARLLLSLEKTQPDLAPRVVLDPDAPEHSTGLRRTPFEPSDGGL